MNDTTIIDIILIIYFLVAYGCFTAAQKEKMSIYASVIMSFFWPFFAGYRLFYGDKE